MQSNAGKKNKRHKVNNGIFITIMSVLFSAYLLSLLMTGHLQLIVLYVYAAMSMMSFIAYCIDKNAAELGKWRIQESTLHFMALLGGWPGAYAAQSVLRHKTVKAPFQRVFAASVIVNIVGFVLYTSAMQAT